MKLVMTLLVRDEADIVADNISFHLAQGVDHIIATDNLSEDSTTDILRDFERSGVLHYIRQSDDDYAQYRWVTHMARLAHGVYGADWVINNDADEFWYPDSGDLKQVLAAAPDGCDALTARRVNFVPRAMPAGARFADVMVWRDRESRNALGQKLPDKVCHRAFADVVVAPGNHAAIRDGRVLVPHPAPITILHFPMRTYRQFANKIVKGGAALERNRELGPAIVATWRHLYRVYCAGGLPDYWQQCLLSDAMVAEQVREGRLVRDDRLARFFADRPEYTAPARR